MSEQIEALVHEAKGLYRNVDFYSASAYRALGIPTDLFTPVFAVSRIAGWTAHVLRAAREQQAHPPRERVRGAEGRALRAPRTALGATTRLR